MLHRVALPGQESWVWGGTAVSIEPERRAVLPKVDHPKVQSAPSGRNGSKPTFQMPEDRGALRARALKTAASLQSAHFIHTSDPAAEELSASRLTSTIIFKSCAALKGAACRVTLPARVMLFCFRLLARCYRRTSADERHELQRKCRIACPTLPTYGYVFVRRDFSMLQRNAGSCRSDSLLPVPPSVCTEICPRVRVLPSADCLAPRSSLSTCPRGFFCPGYWPCSPLSSGNDFGNGFRARPRTAVVPSLGSSTTRGSATLCRFAIRRATIARGGFPPFRKTPSGLPRVLHSCPFYVVLRVHTLLKQTFAQ